MSVQYTKKSYLYKYFPIHNFLGATKIPTYTLIQAYTFINFTEIFPPILLFSPIRLFFFKETSHLYFYSDSSSIRNSIVGLRSVLKGNNFKFNIQKSTFQGQIKYVTLSHPFFLLRSTMAQNS